jgi:hypothetical protein
MLAKPTNLGYLRFWCERCERTFNERAGTPVNFLEVPTDIMFQVALWRVRYKLSLRDLAEMFLQRATSSPPTVCESLGGKLGVPLGIRNRKFG